MEASRCKESADARIFKAESPKRESADRHAHTERKKAESRERTRERGCDRAFVRDP